MFNCRNGEPSGFTHKHTTVLEARRCWYPPAAPVVASPPASPPPLAVAPTVPTVPPGTRMMSPRQKSYINDLGGHWEVQWTYEEASREITRLLDAKKDVKKEVDPRLKIIEGMIDLIPDGFYATAKDEGGHVDFLKIKRPTSGRFRDSIKISTQHSERWQERIVRWPSGQWSVYYSSTIEPLMMVIADHKTCARRYSIELQRCCCCGKELTDDRSRHYLIGPICDKKPAWEYMISQVDELNDGMSFEQMVARGLPTRTWQERFLNAS